MIKISIIAICGTLLIGFIKNIKSEYTSVLILVVSGCLLISVIAYIKQAVTIIDTLKKTIAVDNTHLAILVKMLGIAYISEFTSTICKDCGYSSIAMQVETAGKCIMISMSFPVILALLEVVVRLEL